MFVTLAAAMLSVAQPDSGPRLTTGAPPQANAFRQLAGNKFPPSWHGSPRFDLPVGGTRAEVAPMPRLVGR